MKIKIIIILLSFNSSLLFAQVRSTNNNMFVAKEFSKDVAMYNSKSFLFRDVLGSTEQINKFEVIPLAAASSGELTTLLYKSENKDGLILGFYGNYWNDAGVLYQGYAFKNFDKEKATEFLNKIESAIQVNTKFLKSSDDNNNIYFKYDDIDILIWTGSGGYTIRVFWNGFDSTWEKTAYERSKKRFEKKTK